MKKSIWFWSLVICGLSYHQYCFTQNQFKFKEEGDRAVNLRFRSVNNLIILSALLNGELVNFYWIQVLIKPKSLVKLETLYL